MSSRRRMQLRTAGALGVGAYLRGLRAAERLARDGWEPDWSAGMLEIPGNLSKEVAREIDLDPEAFVDRVQDTACGLAMESVS